ncbi:hypothetical protein B2J73_10745 [Stutzerimonas stutzeri]|jgi:hypothetical protein|nr:hypothetical protein C6Y50_19630 [Stutzerimonas stutzeri]OPG83311.1 hypothetical protein B2J73_10745 [Stutzerimonas stutzeri]HCL16320.1 hypothetical protein [Pseudomonas sp.]
MRVRPFAGLTKAKSIGMVFSINVLLELRGAPAFQQTSNMAGTAWADDRFTSNFAIPLASARRPATVLSHRVGGAILKVRRLANRSKAVEPQLQICADFQAPRT